MIICTRCGGPNEDRALVCVVCGRKLQSARKAGDEGRSPLEFRDSPEPLSLGGFLRGEGGLRRHLEAWAGLAVLLGAAGYGLATGEYLPLWLAVPVVGLAAWLRKL
ncbi:zinc ribbon domain-containing protein [Desulfohalovibrio reitneri]|uniref:zinc ribbon domain-containing protein n=1 Tax=Desulfohalovibrio reitneri TaxID=1307759 RepID=UPI0004A6C280|nr:zinc ribbon domain-containing protein [Desulfohalovibrio reitneri]